MAGKSLIYYLILYLMIIAILPLIGLPLLPLDVIRFSWVVTYHTLLIIGLILVVFTYITQHRVNSKLYSQRLIMLILAMTLIIRVAELFSVYLLSGDKILSSQLLFKFGYVINSIIPLTVLYFIAIYQGGRMRIRSTIVGSLILVSAFGIGSIGDSLSIFTSIHYADYVFLYPTFANVGIVVLSYYLAGYLVIRAVFSRSNLSPSEYRPNLATHYGVILIGYCLFFFVSPSLTLLKWFNHGNMLYLFSIYEKSISTLGVFMFALPHLYDIGSGFTLIPQSIEKLVVMNNIGLPLYSQDFDYQNQMLYSDLLITSSLSAIMTYLTHSQIISERVTSIRFEDRILIFTSESGFTFLSIVRKNTKLLTSSLSTFAHEFVNVIGKDAANAGFIRISPANKWTTRLLIEECFGPTSEMHAVSKPPELIKFKGTKFAAGKTIVAFVLVLSAFRNIFFQATTALLPSDLYSVQTIGVFLLVSVTFILASIVIVKNLDIPDYALIMALILQLFLPYIKIINLRILYSLLYFLISMIYFLSHMQLHFLKVEMVWRYRILIYSFMIDIIVRVGFGGTEITILNGNFWILFTYRLFVAILLGGVATFYVLSNVVQENIEPSITAVVLSVVLIPIMIAIRFFLNSSIVMQYFQNPAVISYILVTFSWIAVLFIATLPAVTNRIFGQHGIFLILSWLILIVPIFPVPHGSLIHLISFIFSLPALSFVLSSVNLVLNPLVSSLNYSGVVVILHIAIPILTLFFVAFSYYGASNLVLILPLSLLLITHVPIYHVFQNEVNSTQVLGFSMIALIVLSMSSVVFLFNQPSLTGIEGEFGVMTYNIRYGVGADFEYDPAQIAEYILETGVAVVGLQEVTRSSIINGNGDLYLQLKQILEEHGFKYSVVMNVNHEIISNAIFSKFPIISHSQVLFPDKVIFQRGLLAATLDVLGTSITVVVTHLTHVYTQAANNTRLIQISTTLDTLDLNHQVILMGDFNISPNTPGISYITEMLTDNWENKTDLGYTWSSSHPLQRIDYIFSKNIYANSIYVGEVQHSDHLPVIAWF